MNSHVPLLLSRPALEMLKGIIDFTTNSLTTPLFTQNLITEPSGHIRLSVTSPPTVVTSSTAEHQFNSSSSRCSSSLSDSLRSFLSKDRNIGSVKSEMESGQAVASALVTTDSTGKK